MVTFEWAVCNNAENSVKRLGRKTRTLQDVEKHTAPPLLMGGSDESGPASDVDRFGARREEITPLVMVGQLGVMETVIG